jgi:hypothetical protein
MWYLIMRRNVKPAEEWTVSLDEHLATDTPQLEACQSVSNMTPIRP